MVKTINQRTALFFGVGLAFVGQGLVNGLSLSLLCYPQCGSEYLRNMIPPIIAMVFGVVLVYIGLFFSKSE